MFEGKELDKKLGEYGAVFVDLNSEAVLEVGVSAKIDLFAELRKLAKRTDNSLDDKAIDFIEHLYKKKPEATA